MVSLIPIVSKFAEHLNFLNDNIYLLKHSCCLELYTLICKAKINARKNGKVALAMRVEGSTKIYNNNYETGRFTITVLLSEFLDYNKTDAEAILKLLNFNMKEVSKWIPENASYNTDIIFGRSLKVNKIYFDVNGDITCYETGGKIKKYVLNESGNLIVISNNKVIGSHQRVSDFKYFNGYPVYWESTMEDGKAYYTRPSSGLLYNSTLTLLDLYFKFFN